MSDVWSPDDIKQFKERQELFSKIPSQVRDRLKADTLPNRERVSKYMDEIWVKVIKLIEDVLVIIESIR